jgi:hypothetical protein
VPGRGENTIEGLQEKVGVFTLEDERGVGLDYSILPGWGCLPSWDHR